MAKRTYLLMASCLLTPLSLQLRGAQAAHDFGHGRVTMQGAIIDTACALEERDQVVELGMSTTGEILHSGQGPAREFSLHLVGCSLQHVPANKPDWARFQVTFDGLRDGTLFGVTGASGIGVRITDDSGHVAVPGEPMPFQPLHPGQITLNYRLQVMPDHRPLRAGDYRAAIRFKVDYD